MDENQDEIEDESMRVGLSTKRWLILSLFCLVSLSNANVWATAQPITEAFARHYSVSVLWVNSLSVVYMVVYVAGAIPAAYILDSFGLRVGVLIASSLTALGASLRAIPFGGFLPLFVGQCVAAVAQLFVLSVPSKVAGQWFGPKERGVATGIGALCNTLGIALAFALPVFVARIQVLLVVDGAIATVGAVLVVLLFDDRPPLRPSLARVNDGFNGADVWAVVRRPHFAVLLATFGTAIGVFWAVPTVLNQTLVPLGYSEDETSLLGIVEIMVGLVGAFGAGYLLDRTNRYKLLQLLCFMGATASMVLYTVATTYRNELAALIVAMALFGASLSALVPVALEAAAETTYPLPEAVSGALLMIAANAMAIALTLTMSALQDADTKSMMVSNLIATATLGAATLVLCFWKAELKRRLADLGITIVKEESDGDDELVDLDNDSSSLLAINRSQT
jgi:fucose permease